MKKEILAYRLQEAFLKYRDNAAIQIGNKVWTFEDLHIKSLAISYAIQQSSAGENTPVAILGAKSFMTFAGICGSLLASRTYMPLNLKFPAKRNQKMLTLSAAGIIIADDESESMLSQLLTDDTVNYQVVIDADMAKWSNEFPEHRFIPLMDNVSLSGLDITAHPENPAYLLFTSGTTGVPKGVPVSNKNVTAYLDYILSAWDFREDDRFSQTFDLTFDLSVHDIMVCWLSGACLCVPDDDSPFRLTSYIRDQRISVWFSVPTVAVLMHKMRLLKSNTFAKLRMSFFCGEPLPAGIADQWQEAVGGREVVNLYGPTETTIAISAYAWNPRNKKNKNGIVCLGKIFEGQRHLLLDMETLKPAGEEGELCLGGSQVIHAYLGDDKLTEKYFIRVDEIPGEIWYRTGDLVREDEDGDLFFLGRADSEVKISGYRVNLFEIDTAIRKAAGTDMVASVLVDKKTPAIISFVSGDHSLGESEIIHDCKKELPWYMIPERIIFVDEMPLTLNGKIDRNKLKQSLNG